MVPGDVFHSFVHRKKQIYEQRQKLCCIRKRDAKNIQFLIRIQLSAQRMNNWKMTKRNENKEEAKLFSWIISQFHKLVPVRREEILSNTMNCGDF